MTDVTVLTQSDCPLCDHAKQVLERVGQDHSLRINEIDLRSGEGQRLAQEAGVLFAPGILLDGRPFAHGRLSERQLRKALAQATTGNR
jgi:glutaredoxin